MNELKHRQGLAAVLRTIRKDYPDGSVAKEAIEAAAKELNGPPLTLYAAAEYCCQHLPEGYEVQLNMENGAAWVTLLRTPDTVGVWELPLPDAADKSLSDQLIEAIESAIQHEEEGRP